MLYYQPVTCLFVISCLIRIWRDRLWRSAAFNAPHSRYLRTQHLSLCEVPVALPRFSLLIQHSFLEVDIFDLLSLAPLADLYLNLWNYLEIFCFSLAILRIKNCCRISVFSRYRYVDLLPCCNLVLQFSLYFSSLCVWKKSPTKEFPE